MSKGGLVVNDTSEGEGNLPSECISACKAVSTEITLVIASLQMNLECISKGY